MLETLKFGKGNWANKTDSTLAYSDQYGNFQAIPFDFTRATTATRVNKQGLIESVNDGIARIDYSDSTQGALLLEPQRTNLYLNSEPTSNEGAMGGVSYESFDWAIGFTNCVKFGDNSTIRYRYGASAVNATQYAVSAFVIMDDLSEPVVSGLSSNGDFSFAIGGSLAYSVNPNIDMGNNIWKVSASIPSGGNSANNGIIKYTTQSNKGFRVVGYQLEQGSYATSYIPTSGTTVTRNQELCYDATPVINSEEGVLYAEISALVDDAPHRWISLSDATTNNRVNFQYYTGSNEIRVEVRSEGVTSLNSFIIVTDITDFIKIGVKWKLNDFAVWINGVEVATSNTGNAPIGMSTLSFTHYGQSANPFFGNTKDLKIYNTALTDAQLQTLTTI